MYSPNRPSQTIETKPFVNAILVSAPTILLLSRPVLLHFDFFSPTFLLDSPYNLTCFLRRPYIFTTLSNLAPFSTPISVANRSSKPVLKNANRPFSPLKATSPRPYIFTSFVSVALHSYYISSVPLQSACQRAATSLSLHGV